MATALLAGCSMAPAYAPPTTIAPAAFKEAGPWEPAAVPIAALHDDWWRLYQDPTLDDLESRVDKSSPALAAALARYDEANAYLQQARSALFPTIGVNASLTDDRQSDHRPLRGLNEPDYYPADTVEGGVSYEVDLWGRVRNAVAAGKAEAQAGADDLAALKLSLESQIADSYIALRGYDRQMSLLAETVEDYAKADAMTQHRYKDGIISGIEVGQSGAQLGEAQAQLEDVRVARALTEHAIASLVGVDASDFTVPTTLVDLQLPTPPAVVPSTLLQRRPDVAAAERRLFAANRRIGVAKAAFYPSISLGGQGGFQNTGLTNLLSAPNSIWAVGPTAALTLFDGGLREGRLAEVRAAWREQVADYRSKVLGAFQQVEDNLARLHHLADEATAENAAEAKATQAEQLSMNRFTKGAVNYLDVVTNQTTALRVRRTAIDLQTRRLQASVGLIEAIGGGWKNTEAPGAHS